MPNKNKSKEKTRIAKPKVLNKIKRKPGKSQLYFDQDTQESIEKFQTLLVTDEKDLFYRTKIYPAFTELVKNLIFIYGFSNHASDVESLKNDCVSFLYESLSKWDPKRGTKAFSYFNVVAKNWLIINARQVKKQGDRHVSLFDEEKMSQAELLSLRDTDFFPSPEDILIERDLRNRILFVLNETKNRLKHNEDVICVNAIIQIFDQIDQIDLLNKRAIFLYIREITGCSPKQLSSSIFAIRKAYRKVTSELNYDSSFIF